MESTSVILGLNSLPVVKHKSMAMSVTFGTGNRTGYFEESLEKYLEIPSDNISFDLKPWMKAHEVCAATINEIQKDSFDFARINFANGDMVGHTGDLNASVCAVSTVDLMIGRLIKAAQRSNLTLMVTADHGNCEEMFLEGTEAKTSHTLSPVPFYLYNPKEDFSKLPKKATDTSLTNVANTVLKIMGLETRDIYHESLV